LERSPLCDLSTLRPCPPILAILEKFTRSHWIIMASWASGFSPLKSGPELARCRAHVLTGWRAQALTPHFYRWPHSPPRPTSRGSPLVAARPPWAHFWSPARNGPWTPLGPLKRGRLEPWQGRPRGTLGLASIRGRIASVEVGLRQSSSDCVNSRSECVSRARIASRSRGVEVVG
jgi:hypothetical protein